LCIRVRLYVQPEPPALSISISLLNYGNL
jgi:hypothetical protein